MMHGQKNIKFTWFILRASPRPLCPKRMVTLRYEIVIWKHGKWNSFVSFWEDPWFCFFANIQCGICGLLQ